MKRFAILAALGIAAIGSLAASAQTPAKPLHVVLVGDSTVSNYPPQHPNRGWGMYLTGQFKPGTVAVSNLAAPGRSTKTFIQEGRWTKALAEKPDYIFIQFGHNDSHDPKNPEATDPATDYQQNLRRFIDETLAIKVERKIKRSWSVMQSSRRS